MREFFVKSKKNRIIGALIFLVFYLAAALCFFRAYKLGRELDSQYMAERWAGESDGEFAQISCFMPADEKLQTSDINTFRTKLMSSLEEASVENTSGLPFTDCWSCESSAKVYGAYSGTADIIACGGNFFDFHPLRLVTGNYFSGDDLMQDNVLLDEDLAWLLFGGNDLEGQTVYIWNTPFRVAGVVARESDQGTEKAYQGGLGLFMSYDAFLDYGTSGSDASSSGDTSSSGSGTSSSSSASAVGITCYEVCLPDPVKNFALGAVTDGFPIGGGEIVQNTGRFGIVRLLSIIKDFSLRSIHSGVEYAYWENAARYMENKAAILLLAGLLVMQIPVLMLLSALVANLLWTARKLRENVLPEFNETVEERVRRLERRQWERRHPESRPSSDRTAADALPADGQEKGTKPESDIPEDSGLW